MLQNKLEMSFIVVEVQRELKSRVSLLKLEFGQDTRTELLCYLLICCTCLGGHIHHEGHFEENNASC